MRHHLLVDEQAIISELARAMLISCLVLVRLLHVGRKDTLPSHLMHLRALHEGHVLRELFR